MKKSEFRKLIREEVQKSISESGFIPVPGKPGNMIPLRLGKMYQVLDSRSDDAYEYEYLGFDTNSREYMFRSTDGYPTDEFHFVGITKSDLASSIKPIY
jgi:hypothetical protein